MLGSNYSSMTSVDDIAPSSWDTSDKPANLLGWIMLTCAGSKCIDPKFLLRFFFFLNSRMLPLSQMLLQALCECAKLPKTISVLFQNESSSEIEIRFSPNCSAGTSVPIRKVDSET